VPSVAPRPIPAWLAEDVVGASFLGIEQLFVEILLGALDASIMVIGHASAKTRGVHSACG
jgi:hypothetical protein